ncbi:hypothetical protein D3C87_1667010 [compost metagenome]
MDHRSHDHPAIYRAKRPFPGLGERFSARLGYVASPSPEPDPIRWQYQASLGERRDEPDGGRFLPGASAPSFQWGVPVKRRGRLI